MMSKKTQINQTKPNKEMEWPHLKTLWNLIENICALLTHLLQITCSAIDRNKAVL